MICHEAVAALADARKAGAEPSERPSAREPREGGLKGGARRMHGARLNQVP